MHETRNVKKNVKNKRKKRKATAKEDLLTAQHTVKVRERSEYSMQTVAVGEAGRTGMGGVSKQCCGKIFLLQLCLSFP